VKVRGFSPFLRACADGCLDAAKASVVEVIEKVNIETVINSSPKSDKQVVEVEVEEDKETVANMTTQTAVLVRGDGRCSGRTKKDQRCARMGKSPDGGRWWCSDHSQLAFIPLIPPVVHVEGVFTKTKQVDNAAAQTSSKPINQGEGACEQNAVSPAAAESVIDETSIKPKSLFNEILNFFSASKADILNSNFEESIDELKIDTNDEANGATVFNQPNDDDFISAQ
jgi:hypothetical protein